MSLPLFRAGSLLTLGCLKLGCFLMLAHCMKQGDEVCTRLRCLEMLWAKMLLPNAQHSLIERLRFGISALSGVQFRQIVECITNLSMLEP